MTMIPPDDSAVPAHLGPILRIPVTVQFVLGRASLPVAGLMELAPGAVLTMDSRVSDPLDIVANGRVIARGEVVVVDEQTSRLGVAVTEIVGAASPRDAG